HAVVGGRASPAPALMRPLGDRELLLCAKPVLDRVSALVEVDVVRTLRKVLPREHDRLLRLLLAARDSPLGHRLRRRGGLSGLARHFDLLRSSHGLRSHLRSSRRESSYCASRSSRSSRFVYIVKLPASSVGHSSRGRSR